MAVIVDAGRSDVSADTISSTSFSITVGDNSYDLSDYLTGAIKGTYSVDGSGVIAGISYPGNVEWDSTNHQWEKSW